MLRELHISNLAVIQDATVEFAPGLNCFTGQTGAGKSLIIGALEVLLGLRAATDLLRQGAPEGRVTGVFHIGQAALREQIAYVADQPVGDETDLILVRRLHESGRTSASLNGSPITNAMLKQIGEIIVDVHGQHDAQFLLKPGNQLAVLDEFGECQTLRQQFAERFRQRQALIAQQRELTSSRTLRRQQLDLYDFQAKEIDDAAPQPGEFEELHARHRLLSNLEKVKKQASAAYAALYDDETAVISRLKMIAGVLIELRELDEPMTPIAQQVRDAVESLNDAAFTLGRHVDRLELDPAELAEVGDRLNLVQRLIHKYAGNGGTLDEVLAYRGQIGTQIEQLRVQDADYSGLGTQIATLDQELANLGEQLSKKRRAAAKKLEPLVHAQLADLGMKEARFLIEFQALAALKPAEADTPRRGSAARDGGSLGAAVQALTLDDFSTASGLESVEFMIAPNPGQPARPLRRIASGGELSRVMLALKTITAQADRVSVLVFDEIDANVGGRMGTIIGEKLRHLASIHQVLCITHLPQIASFADRHLTIRKSIVAGDSFTTVTPLEGEARVEELAEMITGKDRTATSLAQARELLAIGQRCGVKERAISAKKEKAKASVPAIFGMSAGVTRRNK
jgi:DNA repair protein RecN (Recombination protein N)